LTHGLLHHVEVNVSDLKESVRFWGWFLEKLGYELVQEWEEGKSWELGDTYIVFVQTRKKYLDIPFHRCRTGLNHLAFHAESREEVDEMTEALIRRGVNILYRNRHPFAGGKDPDRIKVEFVAPS